MKTKKQHKHNQKITELYERIDQWKQIGPAVTEEEWDKANDALKDVETAINQNVNDPEFKFSPLRLKTFNIYWKRYSIMNIETVKVAGEVAEIFKNKKLKQRK